MKKLFVLLTAGVLVSTVVALAPAGFYPWGYFEWGTWSAKWDQRDVVGTPLVPWLEHKEWPTYIGPVDDCIVGCSFDYGTVTGESELNLFKYGTDEPDVNVRRLFGVWDFGKGKLLVGKEYSLLANWWTNEQIFFDTSLAFGGLWINWAPQVRVELTRPKLSLALVQPEYTDIEHATWGLVEDVDQRLPRLEISYDYTMRDPFTLAVRALGGYQTFKYYPWRDPAVAGGQWVNIPESGLGWILNPAKEKYNFHAYLFGLCAKAEMRGSYINSNVFMGRNSQVYGFWQAGDAWSWYDYWAAEKMLEFNTIGFALALGHKVSDKLKFEVGYARIEHKREYDKKKDDGCMYYAQAKINFTSRFLLIPEIGVLDEGKNYDGQKEPTTTYVGVQWQYNLW